MWKIAFSFCWHRCYYAAPHIVGQIYRERVLHDLHSYDLVFVIILHPSYICWARWVSSEVKLLVTLSGIETTISRTHTLKQMIQRHNELDDYIVAINLNAFAKKKKLFPFFIVCAPAECNIWIIFRTACTYIFFRTLRLLADAILASSRHRSNCNSMEAL